MMNELKGALDHLDACKHPDVLNDYKSRDAYVKDGDWCELCGAIFDGGRWLHPHRDRCIALARQARLTKV